MHRFEKPGDSICVDATPLDQPIRIHGIGSYVRTLVEGMRTTSHKARISYLRYGSEDRPEESEIAIGFQNVQERFLWIGSALFLRRYLERRGVSLFHSTIAINTPISSRFKTLATVYDFIPTLFYDEYLRGKPNTHAQYAFYISRLKKVGHFVAISTQTKLDCIQLLGIPEERISVIPLGIDQKTFTRISDPARLDPVRRKYVLPELFFMYVGRMESRKNVFRVLEAFALVAATIQHSLLLVGPWTPDDQSRLHARADTLGIGNRIRTLSRVTIEELVALYSLSTSLVFPSLYEGFGLPVVEAFSCKTAVLCSRNSSLSEIGEDAALLVDPESVGDIASGIKDLATQPVLRKSLEEKGFERSKRYSNQSMVEATLAVYEKILSHDFE